MKSATRFIHLLMIFMLPFNLGFTTAAVIDPSGEQPDLAILEDLNLSPSQPKVDEYIDVTVVVQNLGGPAPASTIEISWCCGTVTEALDPMEAGEFRTIIFENVLTFQNAGTFTIEAEVNPGSLVEESDESNNQRSMDVVIVLASTTFAFEETSWGSESVQHGCADVPLMHIGRVGPPYEMEDSDGDGTDDRLKREAYSCYYEMLDPTSRLYDPNYGPCQVYLRGQKTCACGTTSLAYTLQYFGVDVSPDDVDEELRYHETDMFTDPIGIQEFAQAKGLNAEIFIDGTIEDIRYYTDQNIPVLLDISNTAGDPSIFNGHWVVALSVCQDEEASLGGVPQTTVVIYNPNGRQFGISPSHLYEYWNNLNIGNIQLWNRLYIPVTDQPLPPGNAGEISGELAIAQGLAEGGTGAQDIYDALRGEGNGLVEGLVEVGGGVLAALVAFFGAMIGAQEDIPLIGGFLGATGEYIGDVSLAVSDITQAVADLMNPETWFNAEAFFGAVWDIIKSVGEIIASTFEYIYDLIVDGVWGLLQDIGAWFEDIGCDWFDVGCKSTVVFFKHTASRDPCMESLAFLNGYARINTLGYLYTESGADRIPLYLYADPNQEPGYLPSEDLRMYYLCNRPDWAEDNPNLLSLGLFAYSSAVDPGDGNLLVSKLDQYNMKTPSRYGTVVCDAGENYGYLLPEPEADTSPVYLMQLLSLDWKLYSMSLDPCYGTETFVTANAQGYTRETIIGNILTSPVDGTVKLYRAFKEGVVDFMFYTDPSKILSGFVEQGYVGYIFAEEAPGTVPLYQFYYQGRDDHLLTTHPAAEGLPGYVDQEILGYIYPPDYEDTTCCLTPLWRFCKRLERQE